MLIAYEERKFSPAITALIEQANVIIREYEAQGFTLTLRQLYYQFVSRDLIDNKLRSYKRLGSVINNARLAGLISWEAIEDRTRSLMRLSSWDTPADIMDSVIYGYRIDKWADQPVRPEVWIEKEALVGVISRVCNELQVPYFACKGYNSQSEQWAAGRRLRDYGHQGQQPLILHLGDHDPSGIDMTRDNRDRLSVFAERNVEVRRLALNWDQVQKYNPPPNPAKSTDSRYEGYLSEFGDESWELDALEPRVLAKLVEDAVASVRDNDLWAAAKAEEEEGRKILRKAQEDMR